MVTGVQTCALPIWLVKNYGSLFIGQYSAEVFGDYSSGTNQRFDTSDYDVKIAAEVKGFDACEHGLTKKEARRFERFVQYAVVASDEAVAQAGLIMEQEDPTRVAVVFGSGIGGIDELQESFGTLATKGPKRVNPLFVPTMIGNIAAGSLAIRYGMQGECLDIVTACATGSH